MPPVETDVLIVGAGPVGMLGAQLLSNRGMDVILAEKHAGRLEAPKAHALNSRSLEILHAAGISLEQLKAASTPTNQGACVRFVTSLTGYEFGALPYERQDEAVLNYTPWPLINIAQPNFEDILEETIHGRSGVDLRRQLEWLSCEQDGAHVRSTLLDRATGEKIDITSRYLIAADGAMSTVRQFCGIELDGPDTVAHNITIHFEADLEPIVRERPAILYFLFGRKAGSTLIAYDISKTWVLMYPYDPATMQLEDFTEDVCARAIRTAIGSDATFKVKSAKPWVMAGQTAEKYRHGRIFLAGDAAHRFPPTGGLGLNTGLADIENLAWKLAAVSEGWAGDALLGTYETERQGVAKDNASQSLENAKTIRAFRAYIKDELGVEFEDGAAHERARDPGFREELAEQVQHQQDHFSSLRLQLGYIYGEGRAAQRGKPISDYVPSAEAGAYLPHVWLEGGGSILDLIAPDGLTILGGPQYEGSREAGPDVPVRILIEGRDFKSANGHWASAMGLPEAGALIIRPDRHILARVDSGEKTLPLTVRSLLSV